MVYPFSRSSRPVAWNRLRGTTLPIRIDSWMTALVKGMLTQSSMVACLDRPITASISAWTFSAHQRQEGYWGIIQASEHSSKYSMSTTCCLHNYANNPKTPEISIMFRLRTPLSRLSPQRPPHWRSAGRLPCISGYFAMKRKSQRSVQVVVSVPARNRSQTHTTRFSSWNVLLGSRFVWKYQKCCWTLTVSAGNLIHGRLRTRDTFHSKSSPFGSCSGNSQCNLLWSRDPYSFCAPLSLLLWSL